MSKNLLISVCRLRPEAVLPAYMTENAAGMDLRAALETPLILAPGQYLRVPTGLALAIPAGFEGQVRPRSGLAFKHGVTLLNSPGTIDADYRGEIGILLVNHGPEPITIACGDRIAQLVIAPVLKVQLQLVENLDVTVRGSGGFGHTGSSSQQGGG
ncbi:MAG: dUTP diphosphatase [Candidatus Zixiibacteriota bacterium]|nr:MAG: dUTP diphosphatase [candidate division Zixibacteria bacterium]